MGNFVIYGNANILFVKLKFYKENISYETLFNSQAINPALITKSAISSP
jgi:hypothetical protein